MNTMSPECPKCKTASTLKEIKRDGKSQMFNAYCPKCDNVKPWAIIHVVFE
jgi:endogenous inhibitor of DNA gyrase (YacG/DUF329 family)